MLEHYFIGFFAMIFIAIMCILLYIYTTLQDILYCLKERPLPLSKKEKKEQSDDTFRDPFQDAWEGDPAPESLRMKTV